MTTPTQLIDLGGYLGLPTGGMLMYIYPAGDCDQINWPLPNDEEHGKLASCLYDAREVGLLPSDAQSVLLPDGMTFQIEANLGKYEPESMKGIWY